MAELANRIAALETEIAGYVADLSKSEFTKEEKSELRNLINTRTGTLNRLLDQQAAQQGRCSLN